MSEVRNRSFHDVLEGDYLEPARQLKKQRDELLEVAKEMLEVIGNRRIEGGVERQKWIKWQTTIMEVDNNE